MLYVRVLVGFPATAIKVILKIRNRTNVKKRSFIPCARQAIFANLFKRGENLVCSHEILLFT